MSFTNNQDEFATLSSAVPQEEECLTGTYYEKRPNTIYKFKICLIGDGGVGKTTFINKVLNGDFNPKYNATQGAVTKDLTLCIGDNSYVKYEVWDTAGQEKNVGLKDGYYIGAVAAFFFFAANSRETMVNIPKHMDAFVHACGIEKPKMYILANKIDVVKGKVDFSKQIQNSEAKYDIKTIQISARTGHNFGVPFEHLTRAIFRDPNLIITADISLQPLNINYDILADEPKVSDAPNIADWAPEDNF